jgi:hypothetical protein
VYCQREECGNISISFDNYFAVSLPIIPNVNPYIITCYFIFYDLNIQTLCLHIPFFNDCTVMALRNKISELLDIHPFSFVIAKLDSYICIDYILSSSSPLKMKTEDKKKMFLYQINPEYFYSEHNKYYSNESRYKNRDFSKVDEELLNVNRVEKIYSEEYEESEEGETQETLCYYSQFPNKKNYSYRNVFKLNIDGNFGFDSYLNVVMVIKCYTDSFTSHSNIMRVIYPRMIFISKNWTTKETHFQIFKYFLPLLNKVEQSSELDYPYYSSERELFDFFFSGDQEELGDLKLYNKTNLPFQIRIKTIPVEGICILCGKISCENCLLPYSEEFTIFDLLKKIPNNNFLEIDNTFLFMNENQRRNVKNYDFSLEIIFDSKYHNSLKGLDKFKETFKHNIEQTSMSSVTIYDCFKNFSKFEILKGNNEWYCGKCKNHTNAKKKMELYKVPSILIVSLKRFNRKDKINTLVVYPLENLDLTQFVKGNDSNESLLYDLFAVCNHEGTMNGGHYFSYCKNYLKGEWFIFNDSCVNQISEKEVLSNSAYLLFYRNKKGMNMEELYRKPFEDLERYADINMMDN